MEKEKTESKSKQKTRGLEVALIVLTILFSAVFLWMAQRLDTNNETITSLNKENTQLRNQIVVLNNQIVVLDSQIVVLNTTISNLNAYYKTPTYSVGWVWNTNNRLDYTLHTVVTNFGTYSGTVGLEISFKEGDITKTMDYKTVTLSGRTTVLSTWQYTFPATNIDNVDITIKPT